MNLTLVLGGVKSGKSRLAEQLAKQSKLDVIYIATATADDDEMQQRINHHQQQRPKHWQTVEEPISLANTLQQVCKDDSCILVDCLTLWLTNLLTNDDKNLVDQEIEDLLSILPTLPGQLIIVSNETNMGIMPLGELTRQYCDRIGLLHQQLAEIVDRVILTVAGLPHVLKGKIE